MEIPAIDLVRKKAMESRCPDCKHKVVYHDMYGCVMYACKDTCSLSGEFLIEYFTST